MQRQSLALSVSPWSSEDGLMANVGIRSYTKTTLRALQLSWSCSSFYIYGQISFPETLSCAVNSCESLMLSSGRPCHDKLSLHTLTQVLFLLLQVTDAGCIHPILSSSTVSFSSFLWSLFEFSFSFFNFPGQLGSPVYQERDLGDRKTM